MKDKTTAFAEDLAVKVTMQALKEDRDQAYNRLVAGIKAQVKDINGEGSVFDDFATDIIENVVKPLYGKKALDNTLPNKV